MNRTNASPSAEPTWIVVKVSIDVEHPVVYANGRQQARITVYIEAEAGGQPIKLTQSEKNSVRLIDYRDPDMEIPFTDVDTAESYKDWSAQRDYRGYLYHPRALAAARHRELEPQAGGDYLEFYLSASDEALRGSLAAAFIVTGDSGWSYRTDGYVIAPDGRLAFNKAYDTGGDHRVSAESPLTYISSDFRLDRRAGTSGGAAPQAGIFNDMVIVSIVHAGDSVDVRSMDCTPAGMIHWENNLPQTSNPCYTGYARPGETSINWNPMVPIGDQPRPTLGSSVTHKGVIVLCGRVDIPRSQVTDPPRGPVDVRLTDAYGSPQRFSLRFVEGERDALEIT